MEIRLLRHATLVVRLDDTRLLVDPMLSPVGAMDPVANAANTRRIPLVDLPVTEAELYDLIGELDGVLVTHIHRDHWDARARELIPSTLPIFCQPGDEVKIREAGFTSVIPIDAVYEWHKIRIQRTGGQHGTGDIGKQMGTVSGFVLSAPGEPKLYIAGDTIWCEPVADALRTHQPDVAVVNAGAAQFLKGDPITMTADDVAQVCAAQPQAQVIAVHMEAVNHCGLTRKDLSDYVQAHGLAGRVQIPEDGARLQL